MLRVPIREAQGETPIWLDEALSVSLVDIVQNAHVTLAKLDQSEVVLDTTGCGRLTKERKVSSWPRL